MKKDWHDGIRIIVSTKLLIWWKKFITFFLSRTRCNLCAYNFVCKYLEILYDLDTHEAQAMIVT